MIKKQYWTVIIFAMLIFIAPCRALGYAESAAGACLMNAVTGDVVFEKNADTRMPMASTTKIMTLLVALDKAADDETVTVTANASETEGSSAYVEQGDIITIRDLEYGLMLNSGNDAAVAIAEHISGDTESFAEQMNKLAKKIGVKNTHFDNPNGLDGETHYTTPRDLATIAKYAMKNERFREIVSCVSYTANITRGGENVTIEYNNHNRLLRELEGCEGIKTGYTQKSGRCLVSAVKRDSSEYIVVTLNDADDWEDHKELYNVAFSGCRVTKVINGGETVKYLKNDEKDMCALKAADDFYLTLDGEKSRSIDVITNIPDNFAASLNKGEKVGQLEVYCDGEYVGETDIVAAKDFECGDNPKLKRSFVYTLMNLIRNII